MTYSPRRFIVGPDDTLYGLASTKFSRMVDDPDHHRLVHFAGQRVRMVEAIVEFLEGMDMIGASLLYKAQINVFAQRHWERQPWVRDVARRTKQRLERR